MKKILQPLVTAALLLGMSATQIFAQEKTASGLQSIDQKIASVEARIDALEKNGLENLTDKEFVKYSELSDQLLAAQKEKTRQQEMLITEEKKKQHAYNSINETLDSINRSLSAESTSK